MPDAGEAALRFSGVTKTYYRSHLGRTTSSRGVESLDLELRAGEIFGLLGLNGSGKTTTMKLALGLLRPTVGAVTVFGRPAGAREALSRLGYLPELPFFHPQFTPAEALRFYAGLSGLGEAEAQAACREALEAAGLSRHAGRRLSEFSKGMLQRVGLAQAILHRPSLILLDEPASGLDPIATADFRALFARLNEAGATLLLSSHSISEVERLCHRAGILVEGRIVRVVAQSDWAGEPGKLETLFVETVRGGGGS